LAIGCETFHAFAIALPGFACSLQKFRIFPGTEGKMPLRLSLPKFRKAKDQIDPDRAELDVDTVDAKDGFDRSRRPIRVAAIVLVALAAGQIVQSTNQSGGASAATTSAKKSVPVASHTAVLTPVAFHPSATSQPVAGAVGQGQPSLVALAATSTPEITTTSPPTAAATPACTETLDLAVEAGAMLGLSLVAPCHENQRVVLAHAGLTVTGKTNAAGSLFVALPAMDQQGLVDVRFADGTALHAAMPVPELAGLGRLAVQWQAGDRFGLHGLQDGAEFSSVGDITAENPGVLPKDDAVGAGYLVALGDASVDNPLMAQIYTYPTDPEITADAVIEAPVDATTCGRELLGQTIASVGGSATVMDLTLSMPACGAEVGYLVLKNLFPDTKIAAGN
jgi:hypothetical protein